MVERASGSWYKRLAGAVVLSSLFVSGVPAERIKYVTEVDCESPDESRESFALFTLLQGEIVRVPLNDNYIELYVKREGILHMRTKKSDGTFRERTIYEPGEEFFFGDSKKGIRVTNNGNNNGAIEKPSNRGRRTSVEVYQICKNEIV